MKVFSSKKRYMSLFFTLMMLATMAACVPFDGETSIPSVSTSTNMSCETSGFIAKCTDKNTGNICYLALSSPAQATGISCFQK